MSRQRDALWGFVVVGVVAVGAHLFVRANLPPNSWPTVRPSAPAPAAHAAPWTDWSPSDLKQHQADMADGTSFTVDGVQLGMTEDQVRAILGRPDEVANVPPTRGFRIPVGPGQGGDSRKWTYWHLPSKPPEPEATNRRRFVTFGSRGVQEVRGRCLSLHGRLLYDSDTPLSRALDVLGPAEALPSQILAGDKSVSWAVGEAVVTMEVLGKKSDSPSEWEVLSMTLSIGP